MVPPPPSQAGKFKPRKPAKKIRLGAAVPESAVPDAPASAAPSAGERHSGGRAGRSHGGRGGGGRGGRGTRAPAPQGAVFFTGAPAASETRGSSAAASQVRRARAAVSAASSSAGRGSVKVKREGNDNAQEEVVGLLETSIGAGAIPGDVKSNSLLKEDGDFDKPFGRENSDFSKSGVDFYFYDSDESMKEGRSDPRSRKNDQLMEPLVLPFKKEGKDKEKIGSREAHVADQSMRALSLEETNWILVQLPTRLPPVLQIKEEGHEPEGDVAIKSEEEEPNRDDVAEVVTPPVHYDRFDNSLVNATPGRLGKIRIMKSGKAVLILEDQNGSPMVQMNVAEGLRCSFRQEAVAIDIEGATMAQLGEVTSTLVVTPDLTKAFPT